MAVWIDPQEGSNENENLAFRYVFRTVLVIVLPSRAEGPLIPPSISKIWPAGMERGATASFTIDGRNLSNAKEVIFDDPSISGRVTQIQDVYEQILKPRIGQDIAAQVPLGRKQTATLEVRVAKTTPPGIHRFRIHTPLGTTNMVTFCVGSLPEVSEDAE